MKVFFWILKRKVLVLGLLALMLTSNAQNTSYITEHKSMVTELSEQFGIPYSVILAVAMVESSSGQAHAAQKLNNHFGIVGKNSQRSKSGFKSRYKQYASEQESFLDFCRVISHKEFYARLKDNVDSKEWVKAISKAGYSEQPQVWEKRILKTISANRL